MKISECYCVPIKKLFAFCAVFAMAISSYAAAVKEAAPVKYVFLFIGDGMSIPQRMMTEEFLRLGGKGGLLINELPNNAITYTRSADSFITDSAAAGTAIACGEKTNNGMLGIAPDGKRLESTAELAKKNGKKVGIITSVTINHATPAAFYAHNDSRGNYYKIALDMIASNFDFFGGGGIGDSDKGESSRYKGNAYDLAKEAGYRVIFDRAEIDALKNGDAKIMAFSCKGPMPYAIDDPSGLRIDALTKKAIEILDNPKGFFIMVEGGKIDWMCHANDAATVVREVIDFDMAVKVAYEFAQKHPKDTLIVVTGDHETGGLTLGFAGTGYKSYIELLGGQTRSREAMLSILYEMKKRNPKLALDEVKPSIEKYSGLKFEGDKTDRTVLTKEETEQVEASFKKNFEGEKASSKKIGAFELLLTNILNNKAGIAWTSHAHTALPVSTTAWGSQAQTFNGTIDNTDIAKILKQTVK